MTNLTWKYIFSRVTSWLGASSAAVPPMQFERMVGVDGRYDGVARRYPGHLRYPDTTDALGAVAGDTPALKHPHLIPFEVNATPGGSDRVVGFVMQDKEQGVEIWCRKTSDPAGQLRRTLLTGNQAGYVRHNGASTEWPLVPPLTRGVGPAHVTGAAWHDDGTTGGQVLYVCGIIHRAGHRAGNAHGGVFRLVEGTWEPVGLPAFEGLPRTLFSYDGRLWLGGGFVKYNGKQCRRLAVWNGTEWVQVGNGVDNGEVFCFVEAPLAFGASTPRLRAAGSFTAINNGTACDRNLIIDAKEGTLYAGNPAPGFRSVYSMAALGDVLYATGITVGPAAENHRTYRLTVQGGIWAALATGGSPPNARIGRALAAFAGRLYVAWGAGARAGLHYFNPANNTWSAVYIENVPGRVPRALRVSGSLLYLYGDFDRWAEIVSPHVIAVDANGAFSSVVTPSGGYKTFLPHPDRQIAPNVHLDPDTSSWMVPISSPPILYGLVYNGPLGVIVSTNTGSAFLKSYNVETGSATNEGTTNCDLAHEMDYDGSAWVYFSRQGLLYRVNISGGVVGADLITPGGNSVVRGVKYVAGDATRPVYYTSLNGGTYHIRKCTGTGGSDLSVFDTGSTTTVTSFDINSQTGVMYFAQGDTIYRVHLTSRILIYTLQGATIHRVRINSTTQTMYWSETFVRAGITHWRIRAAAINPTTQGIGTPYTIQWSTTISSFNGMSIDETTNTMYLAVESASPTLLRIALTLRPSLLVTATSNSGAVAAVGTVSSPDASYRWPANNSAIVSAASYGSYLYLFSSRGDHKTLSWDDGSNGWKVETFGPGFTFIPAPIIDIINDGPSKLETGAFKGHLRFVDTKRRRFSALSLDSASDFTTVYPAYGYLRTPEAWGPGDADHWGYDRGEGLRTLSSGDVSVPAGGNLYRFMRGSIGPNSFLNYLFGYRESYDYGAGDAANSTADADLPVDARRLYDLAREQIGELGRVYAAVQHQGLLFTLEADGGFLQLRWTPTVRDEPENFPPLNTYQTMIPESQGETCQFVSGDDFLYLIGGSKIFRIQKAGRIIGVVERYNGHPFIHRQAVVATKSRIYVATLDGLVVIDSTNGAVVPVDAMAKIFRERWRGTFGVKDSAGHIQRLCLSYDALLNVVYIHNPQLAETVLVWLNSGQWTMLAGHNVATSASMIDIDTNSGIRSYFLSPYRYLTTPNWLVAANDPQTMHGLTLYTGQQTVKYNAVPTAVGIGVNAYGQTVSYLDFPYIVTPPSAPQTVTIPAGAVDPNPFYDSWALGAGANKVSAVTAPDDDSTSYISAVYDDSIQRFTLGANPVPSSATVTSVKLRTHGSGLSSSNAEVQLVIELGGTVLEVTPILTFAPSWGTIEMEVPRPGGGVWRPSDFNTLKIGLKKYDWGIPGVSTFDVRVTYLPVSEGQSPDYPFSSDGVNVKQVAGMPVVVLEGGLNRTLAFVTSNTGFRLYLDRVIPGLTTAAVALDPVIFELVGSPVWNLQGRTLDAQRKIIRAVGVSVQKVYSGGVPVHQQTAPVGGSALLSVGGVRSDELAAVEPVAGAHGTLVPFRGVGVGPYNQVTPGVKTPTALDTDKPSNNVVAVNADGISLHPIVFCGVSNLAFDVTVMDVIGSLEGTAVAGPGVYP